MKMLRLRFLSSVSHCYKTRLTAKENYLVTKNKLKRDNMTNSCIDYIREASGSMEMAVTVL